MGKGCQKGVTGRFVFSEQKEKGRGSSSHHKSNIDLFSIQLWSATKSKCCLMTNHIYTNISPNLMRGKFPVSQYSANLRRTSQGLYFYFILFTCMISNLTGLGLISWLILYIETQTKWLTFCWQSLEVFSWKKLFIFWFQYLSWLFLRVQLTICHHFQAII